MARLKDPFYGAVIDVADELVARYTDAGYVPVGGGTAGADDSGKPRGNASRDEWAAYADSLDVSYDEDAKREDIKAAIEAAEIE